MRACPKSPSFCSFLKVFCIICSHVLLLITTTATSSRLGVTTSATTTSPQHSSLYETVRSAVCPNQQKQKHNVDLAETTRKDSSSGERMPMNMLLDTTTMATSEERKTRSKQQQQQQDESNSLRMVPCLSRAMPAEHNADVSKSTECVFCYIIYNISYTT